MTLKRLGFAMAFNAMASACAWAQANANATQGATDAFGFRSGDDSVGIYDESSVRGFNLEAAGNYRVNGTYFVRNSGVSSFFLESTTVRIGYNTLGSTHPGPSGVVDYRLRDPARGEPASATVGIDPYGQTYADLLIKHRSIDERLSFSAGVGRVDEVRDQQGGEGGGSWLYAGAGRLSLDSLTARAFFGEYQYERPGQFRVRPGADALPPEIARGHFLGQDWALERGQRRIAGLLLDSASDEKFGAGATLVFSQEDPGRGYAQMFDDFMPDGTVRSYVVATPQQRSTAWSTELRGHWEDARNDVNQRVDVIVRGRRSRARFGGSERIDLGRVTFGERPDAVDSPILDDTAAQLRDAVDQWGLGLSYRVQAGERLRMNFGLLNTRYRKTFSSPSEAGVRSTTRPWLYNAGIAWRLATDLELYGSVNRGLEEAGVAPATATNANAVLNAIAVSQRELGLRYAPGARGTFVLAGFDTHKPYTGLDASDGAYRVIGQVRHRGVESSFSGNVTPAMKIVVGGVYIDSTLDGSSIRNARLGHRPVGVPTFRAIANADYAVSSVPGLSVDVAMNYVGERAASSALSNAGGEQLTTKALATFNVGMRYQRDLGRKRMTARAQVLNVTDAYAWEPSSGETLNYSPPRRFKLALTVEF